MKLVNDWRYILTSKLRLQLRSIDGGERDLEAALGGDLGGHLHREREGFLVTH